MTERDPYHFEVNWKPGAREAMQARAAELIAESVAQAAAEPRRPRPKFYPLCTKRRCNARARFEVKGKPYCWQHAKRAANWKEEAQDGSQHR